MKKTSKILSLFLVLVMILGVFALAACNNNPTPDDPDDPDDPDVGEKTVLKNVVVWVSESEGVADLTKKQIAQFNEENEYYTIDIDTLQVAGVSESESATQMITDVESGADIFCFAQDQLARLVQAGALAQPGTKAVETIKATNDAGAIKAATSGDNIVAYPITSDNGYFLIYDKRVITDESHLDSLEDLIADCEAAQRNFAFELDTSAWYLASFFFATGCHSEFNYSADGKTVESVDDNWNSDAGLIAMKGIQKLEKSSYYVSSSSASEFTATIPCAIMVAGTWRVKEAQDAWGEENVGFADLPSFTVDGETYHLGSYSGNKLMGVKPQSDATRAAGLQALALYLSGEECQLERYNLVGWGPSNLNAQQNEAVTSDPSLVALAEQNAYATPQGQIHGSWWDIAKVLGTDAKEAELNDETALKAALEKYEKAILALADPVDPNEARKWTVIGDINGDGWSTDLEMTENPDNTWTTVEAYEITSANSFKLRQGKSWDVNLGANGVFGGDNITLEVLGATEGKYYIQLVCTVDSDGNVTGGTISLIAAD